MINNIDQNNQYNNIDIDEVIGELSALKEAKMLNIDRDINNQLAETIIYLKDN